MRKWCWLSCLFSLWLIGCSTVPTRFAPVDQLPVAQFRHDAFDGSGEWRCDRSCWLEPDTALEQQQFRQTLDDCMAALPPAPARALRLCELHGLDTDQVCEILNVAPGNLWVMLYRARQPAATVDASVAVIGSVSKSLDRMLFTTRCRSCRTDRSTKIDIFRTFLIQLHTLPPRHLVFAFYQPQHRKIRRARRELAVGVGEIN